MSPSLYAIYAEAQGYDTPLIQLDLSFGRLIDDLVFPYQTEKLFFIDGAPLTGSKLTRIKILQLRPSFAEAKNVFDTTLTRADAQFRKIYGEQYAIRFEHLLRDHADDVTSQVIKAYDQAIKPSLKDYLPKREELISAALKLLMETVKTLSN
jgi:hypothetical protein